MKYSWKIRLKEFALELIDGLYSWLCIASIAATIYYFQTPEELQAFDILVTPKNPGIVFLLITGLVILGVLLRLLITGLCKLIYFIIRIIIKINTKPKSNGNTISTHERE